MRSRTVVTLALTIATAVTSIRAGGIAPRLDRTLLEAAPGDTIPVVVMMERAPVDPALRLRLPALRRAERRALVVESMKRVAAESQTAVVRLLRNEPSVTEPRVLLGVNGLAFEAEPATIRRVADVPGVRWVLLDRGGPHPDDLPQVESVGPNPEATVAPELIAMGARDVWQQLGYTGLGVLVAVIDTGIDRTHPDLADHIWTNPGELPSNGLDDDGNGYVDDTWGWDFCAGTNDPTGSTHGTQVAGQIAGDGTNGTVTGMAPDAELMALAIDCDTPSLGWAASDYAILEGADIISQSYSWWWTDQPDYEAFRRQTDAELAAGIIHSQSAGNHGGNATYPIPYNVSAPANVPAPWVHPDQVAGGVSSTVAVGNVDWFTDTISSSSSVGPSAWEDIQANTDPTYPHTIPPEYRDYPHANGASPGLIKPDIAAYGNGTTSICPGGFYCQFSGTSAAQPHVAGTLALMLSANPEATPEQLAEALMNAAQHRGAPGKNNEYGTGLVQALPAVQAVESGVLYLSHAIDDTAWGNGDLGLDPGETVTLAVEVRSVTSDSAIDGLQGILRTSTPGVTIHEQIATFPTVPALGTAVSHAPHFTLSLDPSACATLIAFELELRFENKVRHSVFEIRVGDATPVTLLDDDFESDLGWSTDDGTATRGFWVRVDPEGVTDGQGRLSNPEDDTTPDPGVTCWVTGNGRLSGAGDENNNDVDGGAVTLTSPPFGLPHMLSMQVTYDRWYYDPGTTAFDTFEAEISNDGGLSWTTVESVLFDFGTWESIGADVGALLPPTDDMRLRFIVSDGGTDGPVEGAVDEVTVTGIAVDCQDHVPPAMLAPNPVGGTLRLDPTAEGHVVLSWQVPPVDATHDAPTLFRVMTAAMPDVPFVESGSATGTSWTHVDARATTGITYYRVFGENSGGPE